MRGCSYYPDAILTPRLMKTAAERISFNSSIQTSFLGEWKIVGVGIVSHYIAPAVLELSC